MHGVGLAGSAADEDGEGDDSGEESELHGEVENKCEEDIAGRAGEEMSNLVDVLQEPCSTNYLTSSPILPERK